MANRSQNLQFLPTTEAETQSLGRDLASHFSIGDVICLDGPLGAGKTNFVKGLAQGLGFSGEVTSPSFPLVHEYKGGRLLLIHFDFFRLEKEEEVYALGFSDYLGEGLMAIEWGGKFPGVLPRHTKTITFEILPSGGRRIVVPTV
ncbi:MAG: tRNA (adenosine(37)-N6)-threonylcarbamoyltransferase complex ATPase subunit type 1 TsaE [Verrucomicrobia bacterium]|nr:MAG: tRNA (adenosine(37)-N6)-threonylcarbamoyltransferase complex ATPase subunit type 1 TsaE [Verrucomicrobiota bacterium]